jgi:manganese/zinc/iron transport system permease protein
MTLAVSSSTWIILTGALVAASCGLLGCFLVLRRLSMLGDAISHAVLPGIVVAALLTGKVQSFPLFIGAAILGILTALVVQTLSRSGVQGDAAIGVTFTALFALGVVMVSSQLRGVDLDLECVLYGDIAYAPFDMLRAGGMAVPRAVAVNGGLLLLNLLVVALLYKELKICAFDPDMAAAVGVNVGLMHYLLMGMVSVTAVGAFDSVGAILVVAFIVVPGATAYLLTDRLDRMLLIAIGTGIVASGLGYTIAARLDCSIAGAIASVCGVLFLLAFLFSPAHGIVTRHLAHRSLRRRVAEEDLLLWAGRRAEAAPGVPFTLPELGQAQEWLPAEAAAVTARLARQGLLTPDGGGFRATEAGITAARQLIRRHRLYETYLDELGYARDHQHGPADRVEHHLTETVTADIADATRHPARDPQGKPIPYDGQAPVERS